MRQVIPFTKDIEFKTMINEITNISLEHTLELKDDYNINGDFLISGKYKINQSSPTEESFSYKIPIDITIDNQYNTHLVDIEIDNFKYEKQDGNKLKIDIDLSIDNLEKKEESKEKEEIEVLDFDERKILTEEEKKEINELITSTDTQNLFKETSPVKELEVTENIKPNVGSLFEVFKDTEETFSTYSVYIIREGDQIENIISKYKTTREILDEYNDLSNIKIGTKIIIPFTKDENDK